MLRKLTYTLAAFGLVASMASARADTISYTNWTMLNGQNVQLADTDPGFNINEQVAAGRFTFTGVTCGTAARSRPSASTSRTGCRTPARSRPP